MTTSHGCTIAGRRAPMKALFQDRFSRKAGKKSGQLCYLVVDQQSIETGCPRARKISLHLVADVQNLIKAHLESFNRDPENASRRFLNTDLTGDD